ncbi:MAG: flippase-like domain-containing protein [Planctomycetaceae bacterium]|nr:flippase-like domain-containing protein [Planctomycetaceae bacterium]
MNRGIVVRIVKLAVSAVLLVALIRAANWTDVLAEATKLDRAWLVASLLLFVPQTIVSAWRWQKLIAPLTQLTLGDSLRHTLLANAMNLIVPAKGGDFSKAALVEGLSTTERTQVAGRVVIEKLGDVACLFVCMALGLGGLQAAVTSLLVLLTVGGVMLRDRRVPAGERWLPVLLSTVGLWCLHLFQMHAFLQAAGVDSALATTLVRAPLALFAGLVPGTFCGVGTRDSALVYLYADTAPAATMAVVGLLTSLRYLVPGAVGIGVMLAARIKPVGHASRVPWVSTTGDVSLR